MLNYSGSSGQDRNKTLKVYSAQIIGAFAERIVNDMRRSRLTVAVAAAAAAVVIIIIVVVILLLLLLLLLLYRRPVFQAVFFSYPSNGTTLTCDRNCVYGFSSILIRVVT